MSRDRSSLGVPLGLDGPWLAAILDALDEIADLLRVRIPGGVSVEPNDLAQPNRIPDPQPVKVQEPAPDNPPAVTGVEHVETAGTAEPEQVDLPQPPPRAGRGASVDAWQAWAEQVGVTVPGGASRNDIIAACQRAGVLPEEK